MNVTVNGDGRALDDGSTLADLLARELAGRSARGCAAAVDGAVVPRGEWSHVVLGDGQAVEILTAVQGG